MRKVVLSVAFLLCSIAAAACDNRLGYYAPGEVPERNTPDITVRRLGDHVEISNRLPGGGFVDRVMEEVWEDGSGFKLFRGTVHIATMQEASPYWGYSKGERFRLFFVDYPLDGAEGIVGSEYRQPKYLYRLLTGRGQNDIMSSECAFRDFKLLRPDSRSRQIASEGLDPHPYLVSKYLTGEGAQDRDCKSVPLPPK